MMVLANNQRYQELEEEEHDTKHSIQGLLPPSLSTLAKYGPLIQAAPRPLMGYARQRQTTTRQGNTPIR